MEAILNSISLPRMALIKHFFSELQDSQQVAQLNRLMGQHKAPAASAKGNPCLLSALRLLEPEPDANEFEDLRLQEEDFHMEEMIYGRVGRSKAAAEAFTPEVLKVLRPPVRGTVLVWQYSRDSFQGYYPLPKSAIKKEASAPQPKRQAKKQHKTHHTTSRQYGMKWTQEQALVKVVESLWSWHSKYGGEPRLLWPYRKKLVLILG